MVGKRIYIAVQYHNVSTLIEGTIKVLKVQFVKFTSVPGAVIIF